MASKKNIVVLDLGSQKIAAAVFSSTAAGGLVLEDYRDSEMMADPAAEASRLPQMRVAVSELAQALNLKKTPVRYAIAGQSVFTRFVKLPPLGEDKVDQIVEFEAQQNVPFPINEVIWDYQLVGKSGGEVEVVLVAIKADAINELNEVVEASGLVTDSVDVAPMALYNAFRYNYGDVGEPVVLIDIGSKTTNLVFMEGSRVFTRSIPVGGGMLTTAIAKEFELSFAEAEARKKEVGFVSLGASYEDHPDPEVAAVSKVLRNTMTRLHAEVVRTTNFYRSQQGGSQPAAVYLAGGTSSLPYTREFFEEKLGIPVHYFNAFRNVAVGGNIDEQSIASRAHAMGELVGLALRAIGTCPMELSLQPDSVSLRKDAARRFPYFMMAGFSLLAMLAVSGLYFQRAHQLAEEQRQVVQAEQRALSTTDAQINEILTELEATQALSSRLEQAVSGKSYWARLLAAMNEQFTDEQIWLTVVEPLSGEDTVVPPVGGAGPTPGTTRPAAQEGEAEPRKVTHLRISGLYRANPAGQSIVYQFGSRLAALPFFDIEDFDARQNEIVTSVQPDLARDRWAYQFQMILPLAEPFPLD